MRFHCLQHVEFETPGFIASWVGNRQHSLSYTRLFRGEALPGPEDFDALVIMGGPMSIHDEKDFPWLRAEKELIGEAIRQKKKILGICLGAQLIAAAAGARVYPNPQKEIGFFPLHWTTAGRQWLGAAPLSSHASPVFHWHGETFDLPAGAIHLAFSDACVNQGFLLGETVLGLQFHLEVIPAILQDMIAHEGHELVPAPYIQSADALSQQSGLLEANNRLLGDLLDRFCQL